MLIKARLVKLGKQENLLGSVHLKLAKKQYPLLLQTMKCCGLWDECAVLIFLQREKVIDPAVIHSKKVRV